MPTETIHDKVVTITSMLMTAIDSRVSAVTMNGSTKTPTNGVVDLGTVLTAHQSLTSYVQWVEDSNEDKTAVTIGSRTGTVGVQSLANGNTVEASGYASHAEGEYSTASGNYSHAEGSYAEASGEGSHAEGGDTTASGDYSHAEGDQTTASGLASHAEGYSTQANSTDSHAEGYEVYANGPVTHAEGFGYTIPGALHPSGENTHYGEANGMASHMEGVFGTTNGLGSHVEGIFASDNGHTGTFVWQGYKGADLTQQDQEYLWGGGDGGATQQQVIGTILAGGQYNSHGVGTFNVNPKGGLSGFYIGEENLSSILSGLVGNIDLSKKADLSSTALSVVSSDWVLTPSTYQNQTITLEYNQSTGGWYPAAGGSQIGAAKGGFNDIELSWPGDWAGSGTLVAVRQSKYAVLGNQTSAALALKDHMHNVSQVNGALPLSAIGAIANGSQIPYYGMYYDSYTGKVQVYPGQGLGFDSGNNTLQINNNTYSKIQNAASQTWVSGQLSTKADISLITSISTEFALTSYKINGEALSGDITIKTDEDVYLDYTTVTSLSLVQSTDVYRMTLTADGVSAAFPEIDPTSIPNRNAYYRFEMEITVPYGVTTMTFPSCYEWLNEDDIPEPGLVEGKTIYIAARFDCAWNRSDLAGSTLINIWRIK